MKGVLFLNLLYGTLAAPTEENKVCWAKDGWKQGAPCIKCPSPDVGGFCHVRHVFTPCSETIEDCLGYPPPPTNETPKVCWARDGWKPSAPCLECPKPGYKDGVCYVLGFTPCSETKQACYASVAAPPSYSPQTTNGVPKVCWAKDGWGENAPCLECISPEYVAGYCQSQDFTQCFETKEACEGVPGPHISTTALAPTSAQATTVSSAKPIESTTPPAKLTLFSPKPTETVTPYPKPTETIGSVWSVATLHTEPVIDPPKGSGCYAMSGWSPSAQCLECPSPTLANQCSSFQYTTCYPTMEECVNGGGVGGGSDGGSTGQCSSKTCADKSSKRPVFTGPNCYDSKYGPQFGPNWAPSKKTAFERIVTSASKLYKLVNAYEVDEVPVFSASNKHWKNLKGCDAAVAVYENIVCALELIEAQGLTFAPTTFGGPGAAITEFGQGRKGQLEVAAFLAHMMKETGGLATWEEATNTAYSENNAEYPPVPGVSYHGRGPIQLSYNFNYGPFSEWYFKDKNVLLQNPDKVDADGPMGFIAGFWFWFSQRDFQGTWFDGEKTISGGSLRMRDAIVHWDDGELEKMYPDGKPYNKGAGFSLSTNVINGGIECSGDPTPNRWRIGYFMTILARMGVAFPSDFTNCGAGDLLCSGVIRGCNPTYKGLTCTSVDGACGPRFINAWAQPLCE